jgi:hypothetical protein
MVWASSPFLFSSPILALGLAMMGFTFLSSFLDKRTYTIVHRCNLLPLKLRNWIILPKSSCFKCGLWENGGNALTPLFLLVSKMSENKIPLKWKIRDIFFSDICWSEVQWACYGVFVNTPQYTWIQPLNQFVYICTYVLSTKPLKAGYRGGDTPPKNILIWAESQMVLFSSTSKDSGSK